MMDADTDREILAAQIVEALADDALAARVAELLVARLDLRDASRHDGGIFAFVRPIPKVDATTTGAPRNPRLLLTGIAARRAPVER